MHTTQFHCPHCGSLMAVEPSSLGQPVHCPSCQQIVTAPPPVESPPIEPLVSFEATRREEAHESIFSEDVDEDLFGSRRPQLMIPAATEPATTAEPSEPEPEPAEIALSDPEPHAVMLAPDHWPTAPAAEAPWYADQAGQTSPAAALGPAPPAPAADLPWTHADTASPRDLGPRIDIQRRATIQEQKKGASLLLAILGPYSVVMTVLAGYYFYQAKFGGSSDHPLANIPDAAALFDAPTRRQLTRRLDFMPPVDAPLPDSLKVKLGETLVVGDLEVTPERIERGPIRVHTVTQDGRSSVAQLAGEGLILHLRLKNRSADVSYCPTDPVFDRMYDRRRQSAKPYNQVVVGKDRFYGGAIDVLSVNWNLVKRKFVAGQDYDDQPLPPGEQRQTVICTDPQDSLLDALGKYQGAEPLKWRVQLRRGLTEFNGKEYPVCAVVGVLFSPGDVMSRN